MRIYSIETQNKVGGVVEHNYQGINDIRYMAKYVGSKKSIITDLIELQYEDIDGKIVTKETSEVKFVNIHSGLGGYYLDDKAYEMLNDLFDESVELYPAKSHIKEYRLLYVKDVLESSVDYAKSNIVWLDEEEKRAMMFEKYHFVKGIVEFKNIFRIQETGADLYVSEKFRQRCVDNNLTGIDFRLVYDSEDDSIEFPFEIV